MTSACCLHNLVIRFPKYGITEGRWQIARRYESYKVANHAHNVLLQTMHFEICVSFINSQVGRAWIFIDPTSYSKNIVSSEKFVRNFTTNYTYVVSGYKILSYIVVQHSVHNEIMWRVEICDLLGFSETSVRIYHYTLRGNPKKSTVLSYIAAKAWIHASYVLITDISNSS
jgi:hypothetical protein